MSLSTEMISAGLAVFAKALKFPKVVDGELVAIWTSVLRSSEVTEQEWQAARNHVLSSMAEFPTPHEVLEVIRKARNERLSERWNAAQLQGTKLVLPGDPSYVEPKVLPAKGRPELASDIERRMGGLIRRMS